MVFFTPGKTSSVRDGASPRGGAHLDLDVFDALQGEHPSSRLALELRLHGTGGCGELDGEGDAGSVDDDVLDEAEIDDALAQVGVDDRLQGLQDLGNGGLAHWDLPDGGGLGARLQPCSHGHLGAVEVSQGDATQDTADGFVHQLPDAANRAIRAPHAQGVLSRMTLAEAIREERTSQDLDGVPDADLLRLPGQPVATGGTAHAADQSPAAELAEQLCRVVR